MPLVPGITDLEENLRGILRFVRAAGLSRVALLPYDPSAAAKYEWLDQPCEIEGEAQGEEHLAGFVGWAREAGLKATVV